MSTHVRFLTLGDWGGAALGAYHATDTDAVANAMGSCASSNPISWVINTGDNFYYCGIKNTSDFQIDVDYTKPYSASALDVPWYGILGNHEYGYNVQAQIDLAKLSLKPKWVMDGRYYTRRMKLGDSSQHASFIFLDTSACVSAYRSSDSSGEACTATLPNLARVGCVLAVRGPTHAGWGSLVHTFSHDQTL